MSEWQNLKTKINQNYPHRLRAEGGSGSYLYTSSTPTVVSIANDGTVTGSMTSQMCQNRVNFDIYKVVLNVYLPLPK